MTDFEAGSIYAALQSVALGAKPAASGWIRAESQPAFLDLVHRSGFDLHVGFGPAQTDPAVVEWRASRFAWGVEALAWLGASGSAALGGFHLHWVQGLLYGYSPDEIDRYLITRAAEGSSSPPSRPRASRAETAHPSTVG